MLQCNAMQRHHDNPASLASAMMRDSEFLWLP